MTTTERLQELLDYLPTFWEKDITSQNYKFFNSIAPLLGALEGNIDGLKESVQISTATGDYLESIANLFSIIRNISETDSSLRARVKSYWQNYNRGGITENIINSFADALGLDSSKITVDDTTIPMIIQLLIDITDDLDYDYPSSTFLEELADGIKAAGTKVLFGFAFDVNGTEYDEYEYDDSFSISTLGLGYIIVDDTYQLYSADVLL